MGEALKDIMRGLARLQDDGEIDVLTQRSLIELTDKVNYHLARKYEIVQKEAKKIMGGKVLDYEAKRIYRNGMSVGEARGEARGLELGRKEMIINRLKGKMSLQQVADIAQMTVAQVTEIGKKAMVL